MIAYTELKLNMIYKPLLNRFKWIKYSLYIFIASSFLGLIVYCLDLNLYNNDGFVFYDGEVLYKEDHAWLWLGLSGIPLIISCITLMIAFLMWIHRAYSNLPFLGNDNPKTTPGWAVGWWFIPIASLFKPYDVMKEISIWSAEDGVEISRNTLGFPLNLWWAFWIGCYFLSVIAEYFPATNLEEYRNTILLNIVVFSMFIISGILMLKIVSSITYSQEIKSGIKSRNI